MRRSVLSILLPLLLSFVVTSFALAQEEGGAAGITLKLTDRGGNTISTTTTKEDGSWSFAVPKSGEYSIVVAQEEFDTLRREIGVGGSTFHTTSSNGETSAAPAIMISWSMKDDAAAACYVSLRDETSGMPTGERRHAPVQFIKEFDKKTATINCSKPMTISGNVSYTAKPR